MVFIPQGLTLQMIKKSEKFFAAFAKSGVD